MDDKRHKTLNPIRMWLNHLADERAGLNSASDVPFFLFLTAIGVFVSGVLLLILVTIEAALWDTLGWFVLFNVSIVAFVAFAWYAYVVTTPEED